MDLPSWISAVAAAVAVVSSVAAVGYSRSSARASRRSAAAAEQSAVAAERSTSAAEREERRARQEAADRAVRWTLSRSGPTNHATNELVNRGEGIAYEVRIELSVDTPPHTAMSLGEVAQVPPGGMVLFDMPRRVRMGVSGADVRVHWKNASDGPERSWTPPPA